MFRLGLRQEAWRPEHGEQGYLYSVRGVQLRMWSLGYLDRSDVTGELDYRTSQALLALQGWEGLARTGTVTGQVQVELFRGSRPKPTSHKAGHRLEIHRDRGVLLLLDGNDVVRAVHTSTGAGGATPSGSYRVYRKGSTRGRSRSRSGCRTPRTSWAGSRRTSTRTFPRIRPRTAASGFPPARRSASTRSSTSGLPSRSSEARRAVARDRRAQPRPRGRRSFGTKSTLGRAKPPIASKHGSLPRRSRRGRRGHAHLGCGNLGSLRRVGQVHAPGLPGSASSRSDPVNVVFHGWGTWGRAQSQVEFHAAWSTGSGSDQVFLDHGGCSVSTRSVRAARARASTSVSAASTGTRRSGGRPRGPRTTMTRPLPVPVRARRRRERARRQRLRPGPRRARGGVRCGWARDHRAWWGNTQSLKQCDGDFAASDGWTLFVPLHQVNHA